jgi:hypothetical protein
MNSQNNAQCVKELQALVALTTSQGVLLRHASPKRFGRVDFTLSNNAARRPGEITGAATPGPFWALRGWIVDTFTEVSRSGHGLPEERDESRASGVVLSTSVGALVPIIAGELKKKLLSGPVKFN